MKVRLVLKIFLAFFLTSLMVIMLMTGVMRHFGKRNFENFVNRMEMDRLTELDGKLQDAYRDHRSWGFITEDPATFSMLLRTERPGPGPHGPMGMGQRMGRGGPGRGQAGCPALPNPGGHRFERRITLFDQDRQPLAGPAPSTSGHTLREIRVDGKTVGWLGLRERTGLSDPLEAGFLHEQTRTFLISALLALALSALVSYLLSRHLLKPVGALTKGAEALASRKFDTRITVDTRDELGQLAQDFNRMAQTLERYEHLRRQWISDISHELRTPLAILRAEVEAVQDGIMDSRPTLESIRTEIIRLGSIVNDLHELSLADSGSLSVVREPVDAMEILEETLKLYAPRFSQAQITVDQDPGPGQAAMVLGDRGRLIQVFSNILENSLRYTEPRGLLKVRAERKGASLHLLFEDSKPGVPDESLEKVFDRLYRVDESRSRKQGGTGLGLAICKSLIEAMEGGIRAYHSPLGGLGIEITLPLGRQA